MITQGRIFAGARAGLLAAAAAATVAFIFPAAASAQQATQAASSTRMCDTVNAQVGMFAGMMRSGMDGAGLGALTSAASAEGSAELAAAVDGLLPIYAETLMLDSPNLMSGLGLRTPNDRCAAIVAWTELVSGALARTAASTPATPTPPATDDDENDNSETAQAPSADPFAAAFGGVDPLRYVTALAFMYGDGVTEANFNQLAQHFFPAGDARTDIARTLFQNLRRQNDADLNRRVDRSMGEIFNVAPEHRTNTVSNQALMAITLVAGFYLDGAPPERVALIREAATNPAFVRSAVALYDIAVDKADRQRFITAFTRHFTESYTKAVDRWSRTPEGRTAIANLRTRYCNQEAYRLYCTNPAALTRGTGRIAGVVVGAVLTPVFAFLFS
jgi:hypothetical protein